MDCGWICSSQTLRCTGKKCADIVAVVAAAWEFDRGYRRLCWVWTSYQLLFELLYLVLEDRQSVSKEYECRYLLEVDENAT
jgi:hypothetical protein